MIQFLKDIKSTLYEQDGFMSLARLVFFTNYIFFLAVIILPSVSLEKCQVVATTLGITGAGFIGNKFVSNRKPHNENVENCIDH